MSVHIDPNEKIEGLDLNDSEEIIKKASDLLNQASRLLRIVESRPKPFRVSKILNMMGKTTGDDHVILELLLGNIDREPFIETTTHAVKLYLAQLEDQREAKGGHKS